MFEVGAIRLEACFPALLLHCSCPAFLLCFPALFRYCFPALLLHCSCTAFLRCFPALRLHARAGTPRPAAPDPPPYSLPYPPPYPAPRTAHPAGLPEDFADLDSARAAARPHRRGQLAQDRPHPDRRVRPHEEHGFLHQSGGPGLAPPGVALALIPLSKPLRLQAPRRALHFRPHSHPQGDYRAAPLPPARAEHATPSMPRPFR